jgi:hypothetical protein
VDNAILQRLLNSGRLAGLAWKAPAGLATRHAQLFLAAVRVHEDGRTDAAERTWWQAGALWFRAWAANHAALELFQHTRAGRTRRSGTLVRPAGRAGEPDLGQCARRNAAPKTRMQQAFFGSATWTVTLRRPARSKGDAGNCDQALANSLLSAAREY